MGINLHRSGENSLIAEFLHSQEVILSLESVGIPPPPEIPRKSFFWGTGNKMAKVISMPGNSRNSWLNTFLCTG